MGVGEGAGQGRGQKGESLGMAAPPPFPSSGAGELEVREEETGRGARLRLDSSISQVAQESICYGQGRRGPPSARATCQGWGLGSPHLPMGVCRPAAAGRGDGNQCSPAAPSPYQRAPPGHPGLGEGGQGFQSHPLGLLGHARGGGKASAVSEKGRERSPAGGIPGDAPRPPIRPPG